MNKTYEVRVTRDGRWWMVRIPELDELTQARRIGEVPRMAREAVALHLGVPVDRVAVEVTIEVADLPVSELIRAVLEHRSRAEELAKQALAESKSLARELASRDVPMRDIGEMLHLSHQRVHQLVEK
ncbi:HicB family toxin-antitoxin system [Nocardia macrotermitis]|uniref:HicB family toxin-antitoxin system n=1 Tax=Nocardia macrotermitis TaxID=2585198 RepID=A0A7K0DD14_9NOCA|nr:HicB family toxin-antitoxin system [Nocardia macrotermitis]MQY23685.1 hypothetical protein [Nocardia macrotermitis]